MAASLATITAAPEPVRIGGQRYMLHPLRLKDWGRYERWYQSQARRTAEDSGEQPESAIYLASKIRHDVQAVIRATLIVEPAKAIAWCGLRDAMTLEELRARISDEELTAATETYVMLNFGPYDPNRKTPDDIEDKAKNWMIHLIALRKVGWRMDDLLELTLPQLMLVTRYENRGDVQHNSAKEASEYGARIRAETASEF